SATYFSRGRGYDLELGSTQAALTLGGNGKATEQITLSFLGADASAPVIPGGQLSYYSNYFRSDNSYTDIPEYAQVTAGIYQNVDARWYGSQNGQLEFDLIVGPGGDLGSVRMQYGGTVDLHTDAAGNLVMTTPSGAQVVEHAP